MRHKQQHHELFLRTVYSVGSHHPRWQVDRSTIGLALERIILLPRSCGSSVTSALDSCVTSLERAQHSRFRFRCPLVSSGCTSSATRSASYTYSCAAPYGCHRPAMPSQPTNGGCGRLHGRITRHAARRPPGTTICFMHASERARLIIISARPSC
jgi:hypothetical protein